MTKLVFSIVLIISISTYSQTNTAVKKDSVDIRALIKNQIAQIKNKEDQASIRNNSKKTEKRTEVLTGTQKKQIPAESSSASENIFIKIFLLTDLSLGLILFLLWRRRNLKVRSVEKNWLKKNIIKLRQERITAREDQELRKLRRQLRLQPVCNSSSPEYLSKFAKQQSISKGELLLAARLNSYKRVKDVNSGL